MRSVIIYFLLLHCYVQTFAQYHDNVMVLGYRYGLNGPVPVWDFTYGHPDTGAIFAPMDLYDCNASICDNQGLFQMYTNGIHLANRFQQIIPGSEDFNGDTVSNYYNTDYWVFPQSVLILPAPGNPDLYYLFHMNGQFFSNNLIQPGRLGCSIVDMSMNGGQGQMIVKDQTVYSGGLLYSTMHAVKHANGRDWWIVVHEFASNGFATLLLTPDGVQGNSLSVAGPMLPSGFLGESVFSPDGEKYAIAYADSNKLLLYSFDRCTGTFVFDTLVQKTYDPNGFNFVGCSFSPDSRFLYASDYMNLYQYDLHSGDVPGSEKHIATKDLISDPFPAYFGRHCLGPDGKIYIATGNACQHYHVINDPNQMDTLCNFVQHQQKLINYGNSLPLFPNFRLGAMHGSVCDSLISGVVENSFSDDYRIFPNPVRTFFDVTVPEEILVQEVEISNSLGQKMAVPIFYRENGGNVQGDASQLSPGVYFVAIRTKNSIQVKRFIKE